MTKRHEINQNLTTVAFYPSAPVPLVRSTKSDEERAAALTPQVAKLVRFSLPARELLNYTLVAWKVRREPATLEEIADALGISARSASDLRDELVAAGMIEPVRLGGMGLPAYRPAFHLADMPGTTTVQKSDSGSESLRAFRAQIGSRPA